jgi:hypothetical protein
MDPLRFRASTALLATVLLACSGPGADDEAGTAGSAMNSGSTDVDGEGSRVLDLEPGLYDAVDYTLVVLDSSNVWFRFPDGECTGTVTVDPTDKSLHLKRARRCDVTLVTNGKQIRVVGEGTSLEMKAVPVDLTYVRRATDSFVGSYRAGPDVPEGIDVSKSNDKELVLSFVGIEPAVENVTATYSSANVFRQNINGCTVYFKTSRTKQGLLITLAYDQPLTNCPRANPFLSYKRQ